MQGTYTHTEREYREKYGPALVVGQLYWALPALDPDDETGYFNTIQPARFMGFTGAGEGRWWWLNTEAEDWPARWIGDQITPPNAAI